MNANMGLVFLTVEIFLTLVLKYINFHGTYRIFPQLSQENIVREADVGVSKEKRSSPLCTITKQTSTASV